MDRRRRSMTDRFSPRHPTPMDERETTQILLARGYFPKELPPPFSTETFARKQGVLGEKWSKAVANLAPREREKHPRASSPVMFDMAQKGHTRRSLSIPNPVNQFYLCDSIAAHWDAITAMTNKSRFSLTKCALSNEGPRQVPMPPFSQLSEHRIKRYATYREILQTDVQSFYHSIYTHSIPWALHGKVTAKQNRSRHDPAVFGNEIDFFVQQGQDGQTKGIPVGPDTSRIISEPILCAVEEIVEQQVGESILSGFRYVDDIFLCFDSSSEANQALSALKDAVREFELQLIPQRRRLAPHLITMKGRGPTS